MYPRKLWSATLRKHLRKDKKLTLRKYTRSVSVSSARSSLVLLKCFMFNIKDLFYWIDTFLM